MSQRSSYSTPRWVKVLVIVALVLILLVVFVLVSGIGGDHGPGRHIPFGGAGDTVVTLVATHHP